MTEIMNSSPLRYKDSVVFPFLTHLIKLLNGSSAHDQMLRTVARGSLQLCKTVGLKDWG